MSDLDDIRAFVEVVSVGGFSRAAKRLRLSKSIISRRISRLEARLGARLLDRTTRGVNPTEAGLAFKTRGERILRELDEACDEASRHGVDPAGRLRISVPLALGVHQVAPLLAELALSHPRLEIEASYSEQPAELMDGRFDAVIRVGEMKNSALIARKIGRVRNVLVASPGYLAQHGRPKNPDQIKAHECLVCSGTSAPEWRFRMNNRWVAKIPRGRFRADNAEALLHYAIAGMGIAALPAPLTSDSVRNGKLEVVLQKYPLSESSIYIVRQRGAHVPGKVRLLIEHLAGRFRELQ